MVSELCAAYLFYLKDVVHITFPEDGYTVARCCCRGLVFKILHGKSTESLSTGAKSLLLPVDCDPELKACGC